MVGTHKDDESDDSLNDDSNQRMLLKLIFDITPIGLAVVKSPDLSFQIANPAYREYLPAAGEDPAGRRYEDVWPPDDGFEGKALVQKVIETGEEIDLDDHERNYPDGTVRHFGLRLRRLPWDGELAVLILIWDITEIAQTREQMEQMVLLREAELEAAVNECVEDMIEMERYLFGRIEAERRDTSEKLHSGPMQELYAILFRIHSLWGELEQGPVIDALTPTLARITKVNEMLRKIYKELWPSTLDTFGLVSAINGHVRGLQESHADIEFHTSAEASGQTLPEDLRLALFRIYEEGVKNVIEHAGAKRVNISLSISDDIILEVQDDGGGFSVPESWREFTQSGRYGLMEAAERARICGGRLEVESERGNGCKLKVSMPGNAGG